jgi:histidinol-phosphate aminotransferase
MPQSFLKPSLRGFEPYAPGQQPADAESWVKLNTNESPVGPSPKVLEAIRAAADETLRLYPSPTAAPARAAVARAYGVKPENVALGNGGDELLAMCFRAFASSGDAVAFPTPTYPLLEPLCRMHECTPSAHALGEGWSLPQSLGRDPAPLKFVVNPNSPTGSWLPKQALQGVLRDSTGVVVLDEAYVDFAPESRLDLLAEHANLVILRTLSKSYALAGMRIGFALAMPELIAALDLVKDSYNLDRLAIVAAVAAMEDQEHHRWVVRSVVEEREWLAGRLSELAFELTPSAANFLFVKPPRPAEEVFEELRKRRILVRHYQRDPIAGWFRVTVGTRRQHEQLLKALKEIL